MRKILVVDDDESILEVIDILLSQNGYQVITVASLHNLTSIVQNEQPDLILLDLLVNGSNGREVCKSLKENPLTNSIPIILFSASNNRLKNFKDCNADGILEKPFDLSKLLGVIKSSIKMVSFFSFVKYMH